MSTPLNTTNLEEIDMATKKKAKAENTFSEAPVTPPEPTPVPVTEATPSPKFNKSALIRGYIERHPDVGPTELSKIIMEQHQGVTVRVSEISNIRTKMNQPKGGAKPLGKTKGFSGGTFVTNLKAFQDAVQAVGGPDEAAELLKMLN